MKKQHIISGMIALSVTFITLWAFHDTNFFGGQTIRIEHVDGQPISKALYTMNDQGDIIPLDFTQTSQKVMSAVVHIKSTETFPEERVLKNQEQDVFKFFFNEPSNPYQPKTPQPRIGTGSGVIINQNGYIVTNNHVIADADDIEVTLHDNRTYKATLIGTDPSTDLALLQIKEKELPTLPLANSDNVQVGEWVLAVGNPFNLNSTVTAGIVSAKGRSINILHEEFAVESFIQTDAAINPGNSGGALVDQTGALIGINSAIASPTGAYAGYGFAIPTNIVSKVVEDLLQYGTVQRGILGIMIRTVDGNLAKQKDLDVNSGVYVDSLFANGAAIEGGLQVEDVITKVEGNKVNSSPELQEFVARHRPGDEMALTVNRHGEEKQFTIVLKNQHGTSELIAQNYRETSMLLGADLETVDSQTAKQLEINGGVKIKKLHPGKLRKNTQVREGFIITKVDDRIIKSVEDLEKALAKKKGGVMIEGVYESIPGTYYYAFGM